MTGCITKSLLTLANFFCTVAEDWRHCDWLVVPDVSEYRSTFIIKRQEKRFFML
jgi:hypothetical protein